jgi:hypothetical protein
MKELVETFHERGWVVIPNVLEKEKCEKIKNSLIKQVLTMIFVDQGENIDPNDEENLLLFTSIEKRRECLENPNIVWQDENPRKPLLSKSCGITNIHYNHHVLRNVIFNEKIYKIMTTLYNKKELVHVEGPERICIKPKGSTEMPQHIDINPFFLEHNYKDDINGDDRIQAFVCINNDENKTENSNGKLENGTLYVLENFHIYWDFIKFVFHPTSEYFEGNDNFNIVRKYKFMNTHSRFYPFSEIYSFEERKNIKLQTTKETTKFLSHLNKLIKEYTRYIYKKVVIKSYHKFFRLLKRNGVSIPEKIRIISWKSVKCNRGDLVCWKTKLPHHSLANKSTIPRIVCYTSLFAVDKTWKSDIKRKDTIKIFERMTNNENSNDLEIQYMKDLHKTKKSRNIYLESDFNKCLSGVDSYYDDLL